MDFKYLYTSFSGRINRKPYWIGNLCLALAAIAATAISFFLVAMFFNMAIVALIFLLYLCLYAALIPVAVKRLHDRGKSGHYAWLIFGSLILGSAIDRAYPDTDNMSAPVIVVFLVTAAIGLWFFIELGFFRGTSGPNAYGPDPLDTTAPPP